MKILLSLAFVFFISVSEAKFVFNFSSGPIATWTDASNWVGGVVPTDADSVVILPPDNNTGYICIMNFATVNCTKFFAVQNKATLMVMGDGIINFTGQFSIDAGASLNVQGSILKICPTNFYNAGKITIEPGGGILDEGSSYCPDNRSSFSSSGTLFNYGSLSLNTTDFGSSGKFINNGTIALVLRGNMSLSPGAINNGSISGNGRLNANGFTNNGTVDLSGNISYHTYFISGESLVNTGNISCDGEFGFKKSVYNKGTILASGSDFSNGRSISFDSAMVINDGDFDIYTGAVSFTGSLINNKNFFIGYDGIIPYHMSIINNGSFETINAHFLGGSVINNNTMELWAVVDTTVINIPFINKGTIYAYGPIKVSETFLNSGELINQ